MTLNLDNLEVRRSCPDCGVPEIDGRCVNDCVDRREELEQLRAQLAEAREVIAFYANPKTYLREPCADAAVRLPMEDLSDIKGWAEYCGGKTGRIYLERYPK